VDKAFAKERNELLLGLQKGKIGIIGKEHMTEPQEPTPGDKINSNESGKSVLPHVDKAVATDAAELNRDQLIFELIKRRLDNERQRINDLDAKANNLVGFVSVVVSILLGSALFELRSLSSNLSISLLFFVGMGGLLLSIVLALAGFRIRRWRDVPEVQYLIERYTTLPYDEVLKRNAGEMANAVKHAEVQNNRKAQLISWSWYFLIAGLSLVVLFIILFTASGVDVQ
jgi:hypothetical protein